MNITNLRNAIASGLQAGLPGEQAHLIMQPDRPHTPAGIPENQIRHSAVLLWLVARTAESDSSVVMIERAEGGVHSGQIAFPGGKYEEADGDLWQTALRETFEELGSDTSDLRPLVRLSPLFIPPSRFWVHPYVAISEFLPEFQPSASEVRQILLPSLQSFLDQHDIESEYFVNSSGFKVKAPYYTLNEHKVWGASAMILSEFLNMIRL